MIVDVAGTGSHFDVRGRWVEELRYPTASVLVVAGLPGAGKSQLLGRMYGLTGTEHGPVQRSGGVWVLDSVQVRNWWDRWLGWLPYGWLRPLMHLVYYRWVVAAIRSGQPVVVHDAGTRDWVRRMLARVARQQNAEFHLLLLDVPNEVARAGQLARGRLVGRASFAGHCRRWRLLTAEVADRAAGFRSNGSIRAASARAASVGAASIGAASTDAGAERPSPSSVVLLDRDASDRLARITFGQWCAERMVDDRLVRREAP